MHFNSITARGVEYIIRTIDDVVCIRVVPIVQCCIKFISQLHVVY